MQAFGCDTCRPYLPLLRLATLPAPQKLEQLSEELEHLTTGLPTTAAAATNGTSHAAASSSATHGDATLQVQVAAAAASQQQEQQQQQDSEKGRLQPAAAAAAADASSIAEQQAQEEARRRKALEQQRQAAAARGRHVQLGGRRVDSSSDNGLPAVMPTRIPQPPVARTSSSGGSGRFEGFE